MPVALLASLVLASAAGCGADNGAAQSDPSDVPSKSAAAHATRPTSTLDEVAGPYRPVARPLLVLRPGSQGLPTFVDLYVRYHKKIPVGDPVNMAVELVPLGDTKRGYDGESKRGHCYVAESDVRDDSSGRLAALRPGRRVSVAIHVTSRDWTSTLRAHVVAVKGGAGENDSGGGEGSRYASLGCSDTGVSIGF